MRYTHATEFTVEFLESVAATLAEAATKFRQVAAEMREKNAATLRTRMGDALQDVFDESLKVAAAVDYAWSRKKGGHPDFPVKGEPDAGDTNDRARALTNDAIQKHGKKKRPRKRSSDD